MRELSQNTKGKTVRLFLAGVSYDEIADQLDIAKGSVTNIIKEFRAGELSLPDDMTDYVNELRRIVVDLKKHQVSLNQLRSYQRLHNKLQDMGVNNDNVEQWLDLLQVVAASDPSSDNYIDIVGWIADMSAETGKNCKEMLDEYAEKLGFWDYINDEIDGKKAELEKLKGESTKESEKINKQIAILKQMLSQTEELYSRRQKEMEARHNDYLTQNKLTWQKINTVMAALNNELGRAGISLNERDAFYDNLRQAGSLFKTTKQLESEANNLRMDIEHLKKVEDEQWHEVYRLSSFSQRAK
jgi:predicted DNA-binding protein YlxM (UPF0122 family)